MIITYFDVELPVVVTNSQRIQRWRGLLALQIAYSSSNIAIFHQWWKYLISWRYRKTAFTCYRSIKGRPSCPSNRWPRWFLLWIMSCYWCLAVNESCVFATVEEPDASPPSDVSGGNAFLIVNSKSLCLYSLPGCFAHTERIDNHTIAEEFLLGALHWNCCGSFIFVATCCSLVLANAHLLIALHGGFSEICCYGPWCAFLLFLV